MGRKIILVLIGLSLALGGFSQLAHSKKAEENDYSIIWKRNLFCLPDKSEKPKSILKPVVTPLNQRIALKGIITKENPLENLAVIEELLTRKESLYRVGEKVSGAQITSISQGRVDFLDHNNPETLFFFEQKPLGKKVILSSLQKDAITHVPKKLNLAEAIKDLRTNFKLYSRIIVAPAMNREKKVNGYRIANIPKKSLIATMGFKNNDVITHVNGILIDSLPKAFEAYRSTIRKGTIARVEVLRNGRPNILTYRLR